MKNEKVQGIRYVQSDVRSWGIDDAIKSSESSGADPWPTDIFLNIWVSRLDNKMSGYAPMPGGPDPTDGIVIDSRFLGTTGTAQEPYHLGKTLTHLIGSYLGLYELWSDYTPCGDDYVSDTPIHNAPNIGPKEPADNKFPFLGRILFSLYFNSAQEMKIVVIRPQYFSSTNISELLKIRNPVRR